MQFNNLSVVEFNNIIKNIFDSEEMLFNCSVVGEISSFKVTGNIAYFTIKDDFSVLNCIWFSPEREYKIGEKVKVVGKPNYYVKGGKLNFSVNLISSFGEGEIYQRFLMLKEKLSKEGYFLSKRELPSIVRNIGIVTSSKGAVVKDIISVAKRRNPNVNLFIFPCKVQGDKAEAQISKGINFFSDYDVDVVIVARGGGSSEDLSVFNTEEVARACFMCTKPIISAVGHETDYTLIDLVADIRASTPSVAAEIAVKDSYNLINDLKFRYIKINKIIKNNLQRNSLLLKRKSDFISEFLNDKINKQVSLLDKKRLEARYLMNSKLEKQKCLLDGKCIELKHCDPKIFAEKGLAQIFMNGQKIKSSLSLNLGDEIDLTFVDGKAKAKIMEVDYDLRRESK